MINFKFFRKNDLWVLKIKSPGLVEDTLPLIEFKADMSDEELTKAAMTFAKSNNICIDINYTGVEEK